MVVCSSCHQNGKYGNFTMLFQRGRHGLVHKCVPKCRTLIFLHSTNQILNLWRCRCRCRSRQRCSLKLPITGGRLCCPNDDHHIGKRSCHLKGFLKTHVIIAMSMRFDMTEIAVGMVATLSVMVVRMRVLWSHYRVGINFQSFSFRL